MMLVILDRDGVINYDSAEYIKSPSEWIPYPSSLKAIAQLKNTGHQVVVATNQSGVGRGYYSLEMLHKIHEKMQDALKAYGVTLDGIYFCPHTPDDQCACRKPKPGMLLQIARDFNVDLAQAILVGDSLRDIQAAQAVNCKAVLVKTGKGEQTLQKGEEISHISVYADLAEWVMSV